MTAVWVTIKSCTRWLLTVLYAALVPMLAIASTTLANAHVHSGWFRRTRTACGRSEESQRPSQHLLPQAYERTARCRWWSKTVHSSALAVAPRDGRQHHDVALARRHAKAPQGADGAAHATNRFLHGLNAPISRVGEPEQWSHEPIPCPQLHIKAGVG